MNRAGPHSGNGISTLLFDFSFQIHIVLEHMKRDPAVKAVYLPPSSS